MVYFHGNAHHAKTMTKINVLHCDSLFYAKTQYYNNTTDYPLFFPFDYDERSAICTLFFFCFNSSFLAKFVLQEEELWTHICGLSGEMETLKVNKRGLACPSDEKRGLLNC